MRELILKGLESFMSLKNAIKEDLGKFSEFLGQSREELVKTILEIKEKHPPLEFIKKHRLILIGVLACLALVYFFPLAAVWLLACVGTGYPGYRIIKSYIEDSGVSKRRKLVFDAITSFVRSAIKMQATIALPLIKGDKSILRNVIVIAEYDDGLIVRDPQTAIDVKYSWDTINMFVLYEGSVKPFLEAQGLEAPQYFNE